MNKEQKIIVFRLFLVYSSWDILSRVSLSFLNQGRLTVISDQFRQLYTSFIYFSIAFFCILVFFASSLKDIRLSLIASPKGIALQGLTGTLIGVGSLLVPVLIIIGLRVKGNSKDDLAILLDFTHNIAHINFFLMAITLFASVFFEEFLWRGLILSQLMKIFTPKKCILINSFLFGLWHFSGDRDLVNAVNVFLRSTAYAVAFQRTRTIWLAVGIHFGRNLVSSIIFGNEAYHSFGLIDKKLGFLESLLLSLPLMLVTVLLIKYPSVLVNQRTEDNISR